jgi:hypothetical protein
MLVRWAVIVFGSLIGAASLPTVSLPEELKTAAYCARPAQQCSSLEEPASRMQALRGREQVAQENKILSADCINGDGSPKPAGTGCSCDTSGHCAGRCNGHGKCE